jgi:hypothetical protein
MAQVMKLVQSVSIRTDHVVKWLQDNSSYVCISDPHISSYLSKKLLKNKAFKQFLLMLSSPSRDVRTDYAKKISELAQVEMYGCPAPELCNMLLEYVESMPFLKNELPTL